MSCTSLPRPWLSHRGNIPVDHNPMNVLHEFLSGKHFPEITQRLGDPFGVTLNLSHINITSQTTRASRESSSSLTSTRSVLHPAHPTFAQSFIRCVGIIGGIFVCASWSLRASGLMISVAPPPIQSAWSLLRRKWIRAGPSQRDQETQCFAQVSGQRTNRPTARPTARASLMMGTRPQAPRCSQTLPTRPPRRRRSLVVPHLAAAAVSQVHRRGPTSPLAFQSHWRWDAHVGDSGYDGIAAAGTRYTFLGIFPAHAALAVEWPCGSSYAEGCGEEG